MNSPKKIAIAVFVKTPGVSPVKTRLAQSIGREAAEDFFLQCVSRIEATLMELVSCSLASAGGGNARASGAQDPAGGRSAAVMGVQLLFAPHWAVAEPNVADHPLWQRFPVVVQEPGDLGTRMASVYSKLRKSHDAVMLIGADCPQISVEVFLRAGEFLCGEHGEHVSGDGVGHVLGGGIKHVIGPTEDGGFYLFGSKHDFDLQQWQSVQYSQSSTLGEFRKAMGLSDTATVDLPVMFDVDTIEDLERLRREFPELV